MPDNKFINIGLNLWLIELRYVTEPTPNNGKNITVFLKLRWVGYLGLTHTVATNHSKIWVAPYKN